MKHLYLIVLFPLVLLEGCIPNTALETPTLEQPTPQLSALCYQENWNYSSDWTTRCEAWKLAKDKLDCDFYRLLKTPASRQRVRKLDKQNVMDAVISNSDFLVLLEARFWLAKNRLTIIPDLIELLDDPTIVGLIHADDIIITDRVDSGDLEFHAHGWVIADDLFQVAGRASWLLKEATNMDIGSVSMYSSAQDLVELQGQWQLWYDQFDCE